MCSSPVRCVRISPTVISGCIFHGTKTTASHKCANLTSHVHISLHWKSRGAPYKALGNDGVVHGNHQQGDDIENEKGGH